MSLASTAETPASSALRNLTMADAFGVVTELEERRDL